MRSEKGAFNVGVGFGFIICILAILFFPSMLDAFDQMVRAETTTISAVTTAEGVANATVTLGYGLYGDNTDSVILITSTNNNDAPAPASYSQVTKALTVGGLEGNSSHTLSVDYYTDREDDYLGVLLRVAPVLIFMFWIAIGGIVMWRAW